GERRRHQERVDAAHQAATRTEQLAGRLEPARRRLAAARERDALQVRVAAAEERQGAAREKANTAHEHWLALREERLRGIAAELAAGLREGEACAVCGSPEHPDPARATTGHVDRTTEEAAHEAYRQAEEARAEAERALASVRERYAAASAEAGTEPLAVLDGQVRAWEAEYGESRALAAGLHAAREAFESAEREHARRLQEQREADRRVSARTARREEIDREQAALERELAVARGEARSVAEQAALLDHRAGLLARAAEAVREVEVSAQRLKDADGRLSEAAFRAGFDTPRAAADAFLDDRGQSELQHRLDAWQREEAAVADRLADPGTVAAGARPAASTEEAEAVHAR
ncbi:SMC family ATPase, partial [Streptomyces sp. NPDC005877]